MIRSFKDKDTENIFREQKSKRFPAAIQRRALRKLIFLNQATTLAHLKSFPSNRLEALIGNRQGQHSIRINKQRRVCFRWEQGDAHSVEITDYHLKG